MIGGDAAEDVRRNHTESETPSARSAGAWPGATTPLAVGKSLQVAWGVSPEAELITERNGRRDRGAGAMRTAAVGDLIAESLEPLVRDAATRWGTKRSWSDACFRFRAEVRSCAGCPGCSFLSSRAPAPPVGGRLHRL